LHEQGVIWARADDANLQPISGMPAGKRVDDVNPFADIEIVDRALPVDTEYVFVDRNVHRSPPHILVGIRMFNDPLILRRASSLLAGIGNESARISNGRTCLVTNGVFVELRWRRIAMHGFDGDAVCDQIEFVNICAAHKFGYSMIAKSFICAGTEPRLAVSSVYEPWLGHRLRIGLADFAPSGQCRG